MFDFLKSTGIRVDPQLGGFVLLTLIFLGFVVYMTKLAAKGAATFDGRLEDIGDKIEKVAGQFQSQVIETQRQAFESQKQYQGQLQILTDSHINVSRENIKALVEIKVAFGQIESAFREQSHRLESVERQVGEIGMLSANKAQRTLPNPQDS